MESAFKRLQRWFLCRCNDDWEHQYGVKIETLDNPGWLLRVNLKNTPLQGTPFNEVVVERTESDWVHARVAEQIFEAHGGPENLEEMLLLFLDWAEQSESRELRQ